jgi:hypothetical protein
MIKNRNVALAFRLIQFLGCLTGLVLIFGLPSGMFRLWILKFFTIQFNVVCLVLSAYQVGKTIHAIKKDGIVGTTSLPSSLKGALIMAGVLTTLSYSLILLPMAFSMYNGFPAYSLEDILVHYFTPLMLIVDWLLFDEKPAFRWHDPLLWLGIPFSYLIFALIFAWIDKMMFGGHDPFIYFFIDYDQLGWPGVLVNILFISKIYTILGYFLVLVDRIIHKQKQLTKSDQQI